MSGVSNPTGYGPTHSCVRFCLVAERKIAIVFGRVPT